MFIAYLSSWLIGFICLPVSFQHSVALPYSCLIAGFYLFFGYLRDNGRRTRSAMDLLIRKRIPAGEALCLAKQETKTLWDNKPKKKLFTEQRVRSRSRRPQRQRNRSVPRLTPAPQPAASSASGGVRIATLRQQGQVLRCIQWQTGMHQD